MIIIDLMLNIFLNFFGLLFLALMDSAAIIIGSVTFFSLQKQGVIDVFEKIRWLMLQDFKFFKNNCLKFF